MNDDERARDSNAPKKRKERGALPDARRTLEDVRSNIEDILGRIHWPLWWPWTPIEPFTEEPEADVVDINGAFKVTVNLPGVAKEDIELNVTRDSIELAAVKSEAYTRSEAKYVSKERRACMSYKRVLALSDEILPDDTEASFENGVLTLVLKKRPPEPARERVNVEIK